MREDDGRRHLAAPAALFVLLGLWGMPEPALALPPWADALALDHDGLSADHGELSGEHGQLGEQIDAAREEIDRTLKAWDRKVEDAAERFVVLSEFDDEVVLDRETQLVWQRTPGGIARPWAPPVGDEFGGARFICAGSSLGDRFGWRLPTLHELMTLIERFQNNPALPPGHPFVLPGPSGLYWTSTTVAHDPSRAYRVRLGDGGINLRSKNDPGLSWCVRGRQTGADTY